MKKVDLHTHSHYSADSDISPEQLVIKAKSVGLKYLALTDHDSVAGIEEFLAAGQKHQLNTIPGVELHSQWGEILGYFIDHRNKGLLDLCRENKKLINQRAEKIIKKLAKDGYQLDAKEMRKKYQREVLERGMIVTEMVEKGYAQSRQEVFDNILGKRFLRLGNKYHVESNFSSTAQVIKTIVRAGGAPVIAHPHVQDYQTQFKNIKKLIKAGLVGIECSVNSKREIPPHYPKNSLEITKKIKQLARKYNLILTGGSDYHGSIIPTCAFGSYTCDQSVVLALEKVIQKHAQS